MFTGRNIVT